MSTAFLFNNKMMKYGTHVMGISSSPTPPDYNPLNLPVYTIRLQYNSGVTPRFSYGTAVQVSQSPNVWDLTYNNTDWVGLVWSHDDLLKVLGANSTGVTDMGGMFKSCDNLNEVNIFDTSSVTSMCEMFAGCEYITTLPQFDTSKVTNFKSAFASCTRLTPLPLIDTSSATDVESMFALNRWSTGMLALYTQMSTQANPPSNHGYCFSKCGDFIEEGQAELAQIPASWGGTGA